MWLIHLYNRMIRARRQAQPVIEGSLPPLPNRAETRCSPHQILSNDLSFAEHFTPISAECAIGVI